MTSEQKSQLFFDQALLFAGSSQYEAAIASYDQVIAIKPDNNAVWYNRGLALSDLGRKEDAIASYDQEIAIKPNFQALYNKDNALYALGRYQEALVGSNRESVKIVS